MQLVSRYIRRMPADISCQQFCKGITKAIAHHYWLRFPKAVIYSRLRREVWLVGDCHCLIGDQYYDNPKPYEQQLAEMRAAKVVALLAEGYTESQLRQSYDPAREVMIPTMIEVMKNQNITYAVIDGFPIPQQFVPVITLDFQPWEIVLASDGYPFLAPTLAETEALLEVQGYEGFCRGKQLLRRPLLHPIYGINHAIMVILFCSFRKKDYLCTRFLQTITF